MEMLNLFCVCLSHLNLCCVCLITSNGKLYPTPPSREVITYHFTTTSTAYTATAVTINHYRHHGDYQTLRYDGDLIRGIG